MHINKRKKEEKESKTVATQLFSRSNQWQEVRLNHHFDAPKVALATTKTHTEMHYGYVIMYTRMEVIIIK